MSAPAQNLDRKCHVCGGISVSTIPGFEKLRRVTSDCRPWPKGGRLMICENCACLQKANDHTWNSEIAEIYRTYQIYHQGSGTEQAVFDQAIGNATSRSGRLLARLDAHLKLAGTGRLLDVGCGNGALLRAFNRLAPAWSLVGTELDDKYRTEVENIPGVESLQSCAPESVPGAFDVITMVHVLEHVAGPVEFLEKVSGKLKPGGILVVEVPDYQRNPFDLLIADHCTHFTSETLANVLRRAGYEIVLLTAEWVPKEFTLVARKADSQDVPPAVLDKIARSRAVASLDWLNQLVSSAGQSPAGRPFGIFGTSIAATWLAGELEGKSAFFMDEDLSRTGRNYMGLPVYQPADAPPGIHVFLPVPAVSGQAITTRLNRLACDCTFSFAPSFPS